MVIDAKFYMKLALDEAWKYQGKTYPNPAVGCTIVGSSGEILAVEAHKVAGAPHAEINALQSAYYKLTKDTTILALQYSSDIHNYLLKNHNNVFQHISLYTTLEPCAHYGKTPSCASLISALGIKHVYIGSYDTNKEAKNGKQILQANSCEVVSEILQEECDALLLPFMQSLKNRFVFFKWAQRLDGSTDNGTISSQKSRQDVHALRDVCDLLVIGGNTVRIDRPTLDARLVNGKAPDILILSHKQDFDRDIPLFHVKNRKVFIESDLKILEHYNNIMIEGSAKMYAFTRDIVDYYLCYIAPSFGGENGFKTLEDTFEILNTVLIQGDIKVWMQRVD